MMQFELLDHYGFGNILGDIPFRHRRLFMLAKDVYDLCRQPNLIQDLSLPDIGLFPALDEVLSLINIEFVLEPGRDVRVSSTFLSSAQTREIMVNIFFSRMEMNPRFLESRVTHELTHAIRTGIVTLANQKLAIQGLASRYYIGTPLKAPNDRITPNTDQLYKLELANFHAGYLLEHILYGGITAQLTGSYFYPPGRDETPIVRRISSTSPMLVKIVRRDHKVWGYNQEYYDRLECYIHDGQSFIIYHVGSRITRTS